MSCIETIRIKDIGAAHSGSTVRVRGWLAGKCGSESEGYYYLRIKDGLSENDLIQLTVRKADVSEEVWRKSSTIQICDMVLAEGKVESHDTPHESYPSAFDISVTELKEERVRISDINETSLGKLVNVKGWLFNKPGTSGKYFLWLRDGSGLIQAVAEYGETSNQVFDLCAKAGQECSLVVVGIVQPHPGHPKYPKLVELKLWDIRIVQNIPDETLPESEQRPYPIGKKQHGVEFLMQNRHLWLRGRKQSAILRIRSEVHKAFADFFYERGFYRVDTPIFTPNACEGTTTLFEVDYHGDTAYLAQSGQLYNEADIGALGQVYCFGPTFRAEKSKTRRHLLEFWMLEMEAAYYDHFDNMQFQEEMLAYVTRRVLDNCSSDLRDAGRDPALLEPATETPYPRVRYGEVIDVINRYRLRSVTRPMPDEQFEAEYLSWLEGRSSRTESMSQAVREARGLDTSEEGMQTFKVDPFCWGDDFGAPDESAIGAGFDRPVFVTNFPVEIKGFYFKDELDSAGELTVDPVFARLQKESPSLIVPGSTGHTVMGSDLIGSEGAGELIGGSQREDDLARLEAKIEHHKLPRQFFEWYVDLRRYGSVPHSGFGIGMERTIAWLCGGTDNPVHIRETITFPRMLHQLEP